MNRTFCCYYMRSSRLNGVHKWKKNVICVGDDDAYNHGRCIRKIITITQNAELADVTTSQYVSGPLNERTYEIVARCTANGTTIPPAAERWTWFWWWLVHCWRQRNLCDLHSTTFLCYVYTTVLCIYTYIYSYIRIYDRIVYTMEIYDGAYGAASERNHKWSGTPAPRLIDTTINRAPTRYR